MQNIKMISERQASGLLGVHASTLMHWRKAGMIPVKYEEKKYITGRVRITYQEETFKKWVENISNLI
jgi:predicted site-specific integrase-resolvase